MTTAPTFGPMAAVSAPVPPAGWSATRVRAAILAGEFTVGEVVQAHLARLRDIQPALNAVVFLREADALREADELQRSLDAGVAPGPLFGIPFTVKDVIASAGTATACGSTVFATNVPGHDAEAVALARAAGAVLIAKTAAPEFAFGITTTSDAHGITRNPWGEHSPGGSSGGEAAVIAAGGAAFGLGTDYGGSVRWPAQCCGILGLRPGVGTVGRSGQLPGPGGRMDGLPDDAVTSVQRHFQVVGPLARTVADLALVLSVIGQVSTPEDDEPIRIGWLTSADGRPVTADVETAVLGATEALASKGVELCPATGVLDGLLEAFNDLRNTDALKDLRLALGPRAGEVGADLRDTLQLAPASSADPAPIWERIAQLHGGVEAQLERTPILLYPVAPVVACDHASVGEIDGTPISGYALMSHCRAVTVLGLPSLSIPIGCDRTGLPISVQLIGGRGRERDVLRAARLVETVLGGYRPPPWRGS